MLLSNRVAIITGGARGIGRGIALKFAEEGCSIVIADIITLEARKTVEEISSRGRNAFFITSDVSDSRQVQNMVDQAINKFGKVDILANVAGVGPHRQSIVDVIEEDWDKVIDINLKGVFLCCQAIVPHMKEKGYGKIINISSLAAICPAGPMVHYNASKAGVMALTTDLGTELAPFNICVNAIMPGIIRTHMLDQNVAPGTNKEDYYETMRKLVPMGRVGRPEDIAGAALFLASDLSSYMTGERILVAGGLPWKYIR